MNVETLLRNICWGGIFLVPLVPLVVAHSMFFPFIVGKNFLFRVLVEVIFFSWILLAIHNSKYAPKKSYILWAVAAVLGVLSLATVFGEDASRSFWSNFERMEGLVTHVHLGALFLVLGSMLQTQKLWKAFLHTSLGVSVLIGVYGLLQLFDIAPTFQGATRIESTFGNATYLAVYMLFHFFITLYYFVDEKTTKSWKYIYGGLMLFQLVILYYTQTRGAILGLIGGIFLTSLLAVFRSRGRIRKIGIAGILIILVLVSLFVSVKDTEFVRNTDVLKRFASISLTERTVESRFIIWNIGFQGWKEKPILGYGPGNFDIVFNEKFDPRLWRQEPWFDRAHNVVFDWLIAGGALGLLSYLSLFAALFYYLWFGRASKEMSVLQQSIIIGLLAGYFFQNLFVFDNITSYILFFSILAFVHSRETANDVSLADKAKSIFPFLSRAKMSHATIVLGALLLLVTIYSLNASPFFANRALLEAIRPRENIEESLAFFEKVFAYDTLADVEATEQLLSIATNVQRAPQASNEVKEAFILRAQEEVEKRIQEDQKNARLELFYGAFLRQFQQNQEALMHLNRALVLSPKKQAILFELVNTYFQMGNIDKAIETARTAHELDTNFDEARNIYATLLIFAGELDTARELLIDRYGTDAPPDERFANAYASQGRFAEVIRVWEGLIEIHPTVTQYRVSLAAAHLESGNRTQAITTLEEAIAIDPLFTEQGEFLIQEIRAGRNPQ